jgi:target of rapamycin complex subunit LST8
MSVVLATAGYDHKIRFWEAPSGVCIRMIKFADSQVNRLEITPDKQFIAAAGNPHVRLYEIQNTDNAQQAVLTLEGHTGNVTSLGFQKDGRYLYTGSEDGTIKVWDLRNPNYSRSFDVGAAVNSVCLRADRDEFISGDQNGYVKIFDLGGSGKGPVHSVKPTSSHGNNNQETNFPNSPISEDGTTSSDNNSSSEKQKTATAAARQRRHKRSQHHRYSEGIVPIQAVDISEDSRTLVAISNHGTVFVWDPSRNTNVPDDDNNNSDTGSGWLRPITKFCAHTEKPGTYCLHAKIAPDCRHLVTTASDGTAKLWDTTTWELTQTLVQQPDKQQAHGTTPASKWVWDAAFCADSSYLVTASSDHVARLWNLRTGDVVRQYHGHQSAVTCVALNDSSV